MERILTVKQMTDMDKFTIEKLGISSEVLIERAGVAIADEIIKRFPGGRVLVCVGKGNNGEDGKIVAKILSKRHGFTVATLNVFNGIFKIFEKKFDIIVDCIFGTGLNKEVDGKFKQAIELINNSGAYVVSCDIPSGLNGDTGLAMGIAVKANLTIAIQEYKIGHFLNDGPDYTGQVIAKDIGISIWGDNYVTRITKEEVAKFFEKRKRNVNKGNFGKSCIFGGSKNFPGSVLLSLNGLSSLRIGAGYSNLAIPNSFYSMYACIVPECTILPINDNGENLIFDKHNLDNLLKYDSIAFGMGVGVNKDNYEIISYLLKHYKGALVIDADGLNTLSKYGTEVLKDKKCKVILTPHIKEFSRLINKEVGEVLTDLINQAKAFAKEFDVVLAVKSATSIITNGEVVYLNTVGSSGMAKGGSGDVLSGIITGLCAKKRDIFDSTVCALYIFGRAGEITQKKLNEYFMNPSDVINSICDVINEL